jgi:hypothetical protein
MRRSQELISILTITILITMGVGIIAVMSPDRSKWLVQWWMVGISGLALFGAVTVLGKILPVWHRTRPKRLPRGMQPASLRPERVVQIERMIVSAKWSQREYRARLRPVLSKVARQQLIAYHGIDPVENPDAAREILGDRLWLALETPVTAPGDDGAGIARDEVNRMVATLEGIGGSTRAHS